MDPEAARSGLASADTAVGSQPGPAVGGLQFGGYLSGSIGAMSGSVAVRQAEGELQVAANVARRESSVVVVGAAEAANSGALST